MFDFSGLKQFSDNVNISEIEKAIASEGKSKTFEPGTYTMKITSVDYHKSKETGKITCLKDPSWVNVVVGIETEDGRVKQHYIQIPTKKLTYGDGNSKAPYFSFRNLIKFMAAIGVTLTVENAAEVISKFFAGDGVTLSNAKLFVGRKVTVDFGYNKNHVARHGDNLFKIIVKGKPILDENDQIMSFPDRESAKLWAVGSGLGELQTFTEIVHWHVASEPYTLPKETTKPNLSKVGSPW